MSQSTAVNPVVTRSSSVQVVRPRVAIGQSFAIQPLVYMNASSGTQTVVPEPA
jgi:hypothetical protein